MIRLYHVDAFTEVPYRGNPAAVCILEKVHPDQWMQQVAAEMNLSETAFVFRQSNSYGLKWFTPKKEVSLSGHATLATAYILWEERLASLTEDIVFQTISGQLGARRDNKTIVLDFPARIVSSVEHNRAVNQAIGTSPISTSSYSTERGAIYLLEYNTESIVRSLKPDFKRLHQTEALSVIVTSRSSSKEQDFVSRYFSPAVGIDEDPVTGSAHCCLAPYWTAKLGKPELMGYQASERGGFVRCKHIGARVQIGGSAVTICKGELNA